MSSRQAARAKKAAAAAAPAARKRGGSSSSDDDGDDIAPAAPSRVAAFHLLQDDSDDGQSSAESSEDERPQPKQAEEEPARSEEAPEGSQETSGLSKNQRKKAAMKKRRETAAAEAAAEAAGDDRDGPLPSSADADDEFAMLVATAAANERAHRAVAIHTALWAVETSTLDADAELRRRFGARAVRVAQREAAENVRGRGGRGRPAPTPRRVLLVAPLAGWGRPHGLLRMQTQQLATLASSGGGGGGGGDSTTYFSFEWSDEYHRLHEQFELLVAASADPNLLMELLRQQPCHVGALETMHEVASKTGQAELSNEFLQRSLWAHEASYAPGFSAAWVRGDARMLYAHPPNRLFMRALHRHALALSRRGCHRAALSVATLLLSLDSERDPTRIRLWFDLLAHRAQQSHLLLLHTLDAPDACRRLPGWSLSHSLALRAARDGGGLPPTAAAAAEALGQSSTGGAPAAAAPPISAWADGGAGELRRALLTFPAMLPAALQACAPSSREATQLAARWQATMDAADARDAHSAGGAHSAPPPNGALAHLEALYWERCSELWSQGDALGWMQREATAIADGIDTELRAAGGSAAGGGAVGGGVASGGAATSSATGNLLAQRREARACAARWYPSGGGNPFRENEYATLRAEQVVIPEEEQLPPAEPAEAPLGAGGAGAWGGGGTGGDDGVGVGDGGDGAGAGGGSAGDADEALLQPLYEEAEALISRVNEMERLTKGGGAPHLRPLLTQRLRSLDERLTLQMIAIDSADVSDGARATKRALTQRMDELSGRVATIAIGDTPGGASAQAAELA